MPTTRERIIDVIQGIDSENVLQKLLSVIQEEVEKQAVKTDVSKFSRQQLLDFIRNKTEGKMCGTVTKFEDPFESPLSESDWGLDKEV